MNNTPLLSVRDVSNTYISRNFGLFGKKETKHVLDHVNLELQAGEIFGLTGKSGCGKTTLARCILGIIEHEGEILIDGWLMEEPLVIHKIGKPDERRQKTDEMLLKVGLDPSYKTRRVNELSGGQKQRLCIGRALILQPRLLIADEAISSLDVSTGAQILNLFRELHSNLGLSILFISHNKDAVEYLCDRIVEMRDGRIY